LCLGDKVKGDGVDFYEDLEALLNNSGDLIDKHC
jgi:hypothetical protein